MKTTVLLIQLVFLSMGFAQENRFQNSKHVKTDQEVYNEGVDSSRISKVLIIPFDPKLYVSSADRDIAAKTGLSYYQIRDNMRYGISSVVMNNVGGGLTPVSLMHIDTGTVNKDLAYIYSSIGYKYKPLPQEDIDRASQAKEEAKPINKLKGQFNKLVKNEQTAETKEEPGATIKDGQIHTVITYDEKYMSTSIHNPNLLKTLNQVYGADLFLFINELDIEEAADGERVGLSSLMYKRKVKVHYTIFNLQGKEVHGGAAIVYMPANTNDMNKIINVYMNDAAVMMAGDLPKVHIPKEEKEMKEENDQKAEEARQEINKL